MIPLQNLKLNQPLPSITQSVTEIQETLDDLFLRQLEVKAAELDCEEEEASNKKRQTHLKLEIGKLEAEFKKTNSEIKKRTIRAKLDRLSPEFSRLQSQLTNSTIKNRLSKEILSVDQKIFKLQEMASKSKGFFAQFIKAEVKAHHMELKSK